MSKALPEVVANILTLEGGITVHSDEGTLEYLLPSAISERLRVPEYGKIVFSYDSSGDAIIPGHYNSELFRSLEKLLWEKGKISSAVCVPVTPSVEKMARVVSSSIGFSNATFRHGMIKQGIIPYALFLSKYMALSDDKKEGLCAVLINRLNLSSVFLSEDMLSRVIDSLEPFQGNAAGNNEITPQIIQSAYSASALMIKEELKDFTKSLERRLNRDMARVNEYYGALKQETKKIMENAQRDFDQDKIKKLSDKLEAIETEQKWKVRDISSKYVLRIDIEPFLIIAIKTQSALFGIDIKRRDKTRAFILTYNSFFKRLDPLPCEACFCPRDYYYVCDEHLHIVCGECFKPCFACGKKYCAACCKNTCPKCNAKQY